MRPQLGQKFRHSIIDSFDLNIVRITLYFIYLYFICLLKLTTQYKHYIMNKNRKSILLTIIALLGMSLSMSAQDWSVHNASTNSGFFNNNVTDVAINADNGDRWIAFGGGVAHLKHSNNTWSFFNITNCPLPQNFVLAVAVDPTNGHLWAGTATAGLSTYDGSTWTNWNTSNCGLSYNSIKDITVDPNNGDVWIGTSNGLTHYDGTTWTSYNTQNGLPSNIVNTVKIAPNGKLWIATEPSGNFTGGVARFDQGVFVKYTTTQGLANNKVLDIEFGSDGKPWFATNGGLSKFNGTGFLNFTTADSNIPNDNLTSLAITKDDIIWVGTLNNGVAEFDGASTWVAYTTANSQLPNDKIQSVEITPSTQYKWFGTKQGGAAEYKTGSLGAASVDPWQADPNSPGLTMANPVSELGSLDLELKQPEQVNINIIDLQGREVAKLIDRQLGVGVHQVDYDLSHLPAGIYVLYLQTNRYLQSRKLMLIK